MGDEDVVVLIESAVLSPFGQVPLWAARRIGLRPVMVARDPRLYLATAEWREAFASCEPEFVEADTTDPTEVLNAIDRTQRRNTIKGVMAVVDYYVHIASQVAQALQLPSTARNALNMTDKLRSREVAKRSGLPIPRWEWVTSLADIESAIRAVDLPCVVKSAREAAGIGVSLCASRDEVIQSVQQALSLTSNYRGFPTVPGALIEEYLIGPEVSVELIKDPSGVHVLGITDKTVSGFPHFVETGHTFPSALPETLTGAAYQLALATLEAHELDVGAAHVEVKLTQDGPKLIEINPRLPGAYITRMILEATGLDMAVQTIRAHCGQRVELNRTNYMAASTRSVFARNAGTVTAINGLQQMDRVIGLRDVSLRVQPGDSVLPPSSNVGVLGTVLTVGQSPAESAAWATAAADSIHIQVEKNRDNVG